MTAPPCPLFPPHRNRPETNHVTVLPNRGEYGLFRLEAVIGPWPPLSRRKVQCRVDSWRTLVKAYEQEDLLLRKLVASCPRDLRDHAGAEGSLSCKSTLAHLAYWDAFTVDFFQSRFDPGTYPAQPPLDFEDRDRAALDNSSTLPFGEVLARYLEASHSLREFLGTYWDRLNSREKYEFRIPLRHHREHRLALEEVMSRVGAHNLPDSMAHGA